LCGAVYQTLTATVQIESAKILIEMFLFCTHSANQNIRRTNVAIAAGQSVWDKDVNNGNGRSSFDGQ
jgi:hypothetical protein